MSDDELRKKVQTNFIIFFVFLAVVMGLILTSIALGAFGKVPVMIILIPIGISVVCIAPLYLLFKKATEQKRILKERNLIQ